MRELAEVAAEQEWLDPAGRALRSAVRETFQGESARTVKDVLNGVWLGHPLHPVLTDIPIGAWTMAQVFDTLDAAGGGNRYEDAALVCINIGLVGALGAAVTGLTDWSDTGKEDRRVGLIHGLINITATGLFLTSAILRKRKRTSAAVGASTAGYAVAMAGAYLGGALVYQRRLGTDHAIRAEAPDGFTRTIRASELPDGDKRKVTVGDAEIVLIRRGGEVYALRSVAHIAVARCPKVKCETGRSSARGTSRSSSSRTGTSSTGRPPSISRATPHGSPTGSSR